jgi:hypothetical protein
VVDLDLGLAVGVFSPALELSEALPFGASCATTWLNLMTIGLARRRADAVAAAANAVEPLRILASVISPPWVS